MPIKIDLNRLKQASTKFRFLTFLNCLLVYLNCLRSCCPTTLVIIYMSELVYQVAVDKESILGNLTNNTPRCVMGIFEAS